MILSLKGFSQIVADSAAAVQGACSSLIDMTSGSVLRAVLEASASVGLWMQWLILQVWQGTRLSTSTGVDVDSFVNDFGLARLPSVTATGFVTFSRFAAVGSAMVPLGAKVTTADLSQSFQVTQDTTNPAWSAPLGGYLMQANTYSVTVPVVALVGGSAGNVQAGAVSLISIATPGVDTVTNAAPLQNGADAESDAALKARFAAYINTLSRATLAAVQFAINSVQQGLTYSISENQDAAGNYHPGNFVIVVDDGTGHPSPTILSGVTAKVNTVRPIGSTFTVIGPTITLANISLSISVGPNGNRSLIAANVATALTDYIDALAIAAPLPYSVISKIAWDTDPNITNVTQISLNGGLTDLVVGVSGVIKAGVIAVN